MRDFFTVHVQVESWASAYPEASKLCRRHWEEIAGNKDTIPLSPRWDRYEAMDKLGLLHITTARDETSDGKMLGYLLYIVMPHLHYSTSLTALGDVLYLVPEARLGTTGIRLIKIAEDSLKGRGVQRILQNVKLAHDWGPILKRMGFTEFETIYQKVIG